MITKILLWPLLENENPGGVTNTLIYHRHTDNSIIIIVVVIIPQSFVYKLLNGKYF